MKPDIKIHMKQCKIQKVFLEPGEARTLEFTIHPNEDLSFTGPDYNKIIEPGEFKVLIGNSSENILMEKNFYISLKK
jgi:beta-glucosidase